MSNTTDPKSKLDVASDTSDVKVTNLPSYKNEAPKLFAGADKVYSLEKPSSFTSIGPYQASKATYDPETNTFGIPVNETAKDWFSIPFEMLYKSGTVGPNDAAILVQRALYHKGYLSKPDPTPTFPTDANLVKSLPKFDSFPVVGCDAAALKKFFSATVKKLNEFEGRFICERTNMIMFCQLFLDNLELLSTVGLAKAQAFSFKLFNTLVKKSESCFVLNVGKLFPHTTRGMTKETLSEWFVSSHYTSEWIVGRGKPKNDLPPDEPVDETKRSIYEYAKDKAETLKAFYTEVPFPYLFGIICHHLEQNSSQADTPEEIFKKCTSVITSAIQVESNRRGELQRLKDENKRLEILLAAPSPTSGSSKRKKKASKVQGNNSETEKPHDAESEVEPEKSTLLKRVFKRLVIDTMSWIYGKIRSAIVQTVRYLVLVPITYTIALFYPKPFKLGDVSPSYSGLSYMDRPFFRWFRFKPSPPGLNE